MVKKALFWLVLVILLLGTTACFHIRVQKDMEFPAHRFSAALAWLADMGRHNPDRVGRVRRICALVYDGESRELVDMSVPVGLAKLAMNEDRGHERRAERGADGAASRYVDLDDWSLRDIRKLGPGLLVQVDDQDERTHILVWLE